VKRKREESGLTLVELLIVLAVISLLVGLLIPAVTAVKNSAREAKQKGQFFAIDVALTAFKDDYGDYPPSYYGHPRTGAGVPPGIYCGSQKLAEALLGWDLLGFHPRSDWRWDGLDAAGGPGSYDPAKVRGNATFDERKSPYIEEGTRYAFTLADLYRSHPLATQPGANRYLFCDVYGATKVTLPSGSTAKAGAPILYYKADPSGKFNDPALVDPARPCDNRGNVYNCLDNVTIVQIKEAVDGIAVPFDKNAFYAYIRDPKITAKQWPYRPGSYILISAGADGIYGTPDDIRNFGD